MFTHPLTEQLQGLKLTGMAQALQEQLQDTQTHRLSFEERLALLVDRERALQDNKQLSYRLQQARLRYPQACLNDLDRGSARQLDATLLVKLSTTDWLREHRNVIITGATGTGKSWLACALAHKACLNGFKTRYFRLPQLMETLCLAQARAKERHLPLPKTLMRVPLLVIDDWALYPLEVVAQQQLLLDILEERYQKASTLVTSQFPVKAWHDQFKSPTFADAIMDRLLGHEAYQLTLAGPSLRRQKPVQPTVETTVTTVTSPVSVGEEKTESVAD